MQWIQVVTFVIWFEVWGRDIDVYYPGGGLAITLSCCGLLVMAIAVHACIRKLYIPDKAFLKQEIEKLDRRRLLLAYIFSTLFLTSIGFIAGLTSGAAQILITISTFKWVFFLLFGFSIWTGDRKYKIIFLVILMYEFVASLNSYFSSFKEVFLFSTILALTFVRSIKLKQILYSLLIILFFAVLILTWNAVKSDYRSFLSKGQRAQVVAVERGAALNKIQDQVQNLNWARYQMSIYMTLYRVQYLQHFAMVVERVPKLTPYQNGAVWWENISFVITPRFLFPEKAIYNPTEKTNKFTGKRYAGLKEGSAFSLGYFVDGYVDFGPIGMFIPLIFMGLFVAFIYRTFYKMTSLNYFLRLSMINVCLYSFIFFESDGLFLFGRLLTSFLVFLILSKTIFPRIQKWLYHSSHGR
jgi:hypothetical protein